MVAKQDKARSHLFPQVPTLFAGETARAARFQSPTRCSSPQSEPWIDISKPAPLTEQYARSPQYRCDAVATIMCSTNKHGSGNSIHALFLFTQDYMVETFGRNIDASAAGGLKGVPELTEDDIDEVSEELWYVCVRSPRCCACVSWNRVPAPLMQQVPPGRADGQERR
jgi:hypothetical protein